MILYMNLPLTAFMFIAEDGKHQSGGYCSAIAAVLEHTSRQCSRLV